MLALRFARRLRAVPVLLLLLGSFVSAPASAETQLQAAKRLYQAASHHYDLQEFEKALDEFKQAYEAKDDPVFLFNIAQCQRSLGQNEPALRSYKTYLLRAPNAPNRSDVATRIATLEAEIAQAKSEHAQARGRDHEAERTDEVATTQPTTTTTAPPTTDTHDDRPLTCAIAVVFDRDEHAARERARRDTAAAQEAGLQTMVVVDDRGRGGGRRRARRGAWSRALALAWTARRAARELSIMETMILAKVAKLRCSLPCICRPRLAGCGGDQADACAKAPTGSCLTLEISGPSKAQVAKLIAVDRDGRLHGCDRARALHSTAPDVAARSRGRGAAASRPSWAM